jgi:predicted lysophospholipase L1 biosynthesis ABC-type transport system permease subunit
MLLRRNAPNRERPYRIWLYPLTCLLALVGWLMLFVTSDVKSLAIGGGSLVAGVIVFLVWSKVERSWPFANTTPLETG